MKLLLLTKHLTLLLMSAAMSSAAKAQLSFAPQVTYPTGIDPYGVAVGDFNGDGIQDLAVTNTFSNNVSILLGNGDGSFQSQVTYATGTNPDGVAVGDFSGDGKQDIVVSNLFSNTISVLLGNGDGTFGTAVPYGTDMGAFVTTGDLTAMENKTLQHLTFQLYPTAWHIYFSVMAMALSNHRLVIA